MFRKLVEDRIFNLSGNQFQDFCDIICLKLYPNDYTPVRAGGRNGDGKNDGYCPKARIFFQAHATRGEAEGKIKSKIDLDIDGCLTKHRDVKTWVYLTNDTLTGEIHRHIDNVVRPKYSNVKIEIWDHKVIADKISELPEEEIKEILGMNSDGKTIKNYHAEKGATLIDNSGIVKGGLIGTQNNYYAADQENEDREITVIDEIFNDVIKQLEGNVDHDRSTKHLNLRDKIKLNFEDENDQDIVRRYFEYALLKINLVQMRIEQEDPEIQIDLQSFVFAKYNELHRKNLSNIEILEGLFAEFIIEGRNDDPIYSNLTRAFVLFFFDDCTIFEKTREEIDKQIKLFH